ncbi:hypothetical protein Rctr197k_137 [Virus Rctr197k]|nr:hypothetical protein Rctr197k_137 [Virus Rctr197k]
MWWLDVRSFLWMIALGLGRVVLEVVVLAGPPVAVSVALTHVGMFSFPGLVVGVLGTLWIFWASQRLFR